MALLTLVKKSIVLLSDFNQPPKTLIFLSIMRVRWKSLSSKQNPFITYLYRLEIYVHNASRSTRKGNNARE